MIERYQKCQHGINLLSNRLIVSRAFAREGEDVVVACSRQEKVVLVSFGESYHGDVLQFAKQL